MEIRTWLNQQLVLPADMNGFNSDMYQRDYDYNNNPPVILYGLQFVSVTGNTAAFTPGAARCSDITVADYPYLPVPSYGVGYPGVIEIPGTVNSITLDPMISPCYIVATYSISPNTAGETLYTVTGHLSQVSSVTPSTQVVLAHATISMSVWTVVQTPITYRSSDNYGQSGIQYNLDTGVLQIGYPVGASGNSLNLSHPTTLSSTLSTSGGLNLVPAKIDVATTSTIAALTSAATMIRFTGSTATALQGIVAGVTAQVITLYNQSSATVTLKNNNGSASAPNRILCPTGADMLLLAGYSIQLIYDITAALWIPIFFA